MKTTSYDFTEAIKYLDEVYKPSELSATLKTAALELAYIEDDDADVVKHAQCAAVIVCNFLDAIKEREVQPWE